MKKILLLAAAIALLAVPAMAGIKDSRHNLGNTGDFAYRATGGVTQICMFCHTPHNPVQNVPLWNRNAPNQAGYRFYSSVTIATGNTKASLEATSISLFCLSCHDGTNNLFALVKNQRNEGAVTGNTMSIRATRTNIMSGTDMMRNDHPVNVRIGLAAIGDTANWNAKADIIGIGGLRLFVGTNGDDYVECASCHDPHKTDNGLFLRKSNASSSVCLTCHNK